MIQNTVGQSIGAQILNATSGAAFTSAVTCYVTGDAGTQAIGSVGSGLCTHEGNGYHTYRPSAAETNYSLIAFTFTGTGAVPATIQVETVTAAQAALAVAAAAAAVTAIPVLTILKNALKLHNVYASGEPVKPADAVDCLSWLNMILDDWSATAASSVTSVISQFTTTPGSSSYTIGPTGDVVLPTRPVTIEGIALEISAGQWLPVFVHTDPLWGRQWWLLQAPAVNGDTLTDALYLPQVPNGTLYFNSAPTSALTVRIATRYTLAAVIQTQSLTLAPGWQSALTLTLAEKIAPMFHATISAELKADAGKARALIFGNNLRIRSLSCAGMGLPGTGSGRYWDTTNGVWRSR